jgi:hypothetical protein
MFLQWAEILVLGDFAAVARFERTDHRGDNLEMLSGNLSQQWGIHDFRALTRHYITFSSHY